MIFFCFTFTTYITELQKGKEGGARGTGTRAVPPVGPGLRVSGVSASPGLFLRAGHWARAPAAWEGAWPHVGEDEGCCRASPAWGEGVPGAGGLWLKKTWEN